MDPDVLLLTCRTVTCSGVFVPSWGSFTRRNDPAHLNVQEVHTGDTPLIASCRHGHLNVVRYLLDNKANSQLTNKKQRTCLHYASKRTFSLLDYLMIAILMPILLLGYFIMVWPISSLSQPDIIQVKHSLICSQVFLCCSLKLSPAVCFTGRSFQIFMVKVTTTKTFKLRAVRQKRRNENKLWS
ncbi:ankyrin repeat domain-containing protein 22 isoform X3 [Oreochromis niloticus]|uniref:ankyrin repeat domain-containing protein 22 isoform X3 n=1 Tax=Oreochromis niloticus TaxID=8128 RepID=UPI000DF45E01|nr:ankyrin repeat domain-containing protein 22 isoform X3 [Oreochromis niloticus]